MTCTCMWANLGYIFISFSVSVQTCLDEVNMVELGYVDLTILWCRYDDDAALIYTIFGLAPIYLRSDHIGMIQS